MSLPSDYEIQLTTDTGVFRFGGGDEVFVEPLEDGVAVTLNNAVLDAIRRLQSVQEEAGE